MWNKTPTPVLQNLAGTECLLTQSSCRLDFSLLEISILEGLTPMGVLELYPRVRCVFIHVEALLGWAVPGYTQTGLRSKLFSQ